MKRCFKRRSWKSSHARRSERISPAVQEPPLLVVIPAAALAAALGAEERARRPPTATPTNAQLTTRRAARTMDAGEDAPREAHHVGDAAVGDGAAGAGGGGVLHAHGSAAPPPDAIVRPDEALRQERGELQAEHQRTSCMSTAASSSACGDDAPGRMRYTSTHAQRTPTVPTAYLRRGREGGVTESRGEGWRRECAWRRALCACLAARRTARRGRKSRGRRAREGPAGRWRSATRTRRRAGCRPAGRQRSRSARTGAARALDDADGDRREKRHRDRAAEDAGEPPPARTAHDFCRRSPSPAQAASRRRRRSSRRRRRRPLARSRASARCSCLERRETGRCCIS